jgi:hypothetical protein
VIMVELVPPMVCVPLPVSTTAGMAPPVADSLDAALSVS